MNFRRIKHTLLRLSLEEKVIGIGTILMMVFCFFPWYTTTSIVDKTTSTEYGLSGDLGVIGFVIFLMSLLGLLAMVSENLRLPFPKFGHKRENIVFFFTGQATFLTLLMLAVYTKRSLDFTNADIRFGLYATLAIGFFSALSAFRLIQKTKYLLPQEVDMEEEELHKENPEAPAQEQSATEKIMAFGEDEALMDEIDQAFDEPKTAEKTTEEPPKDHPKEDQSNYFTREAGVDK